MQKVLIESFKPMFILRLSVTMELDLELVKLIKNNSSKIISDFKITENRMEKNIAFLSDCN